MSMKAGGKNWVESRAGYLVDGGDFLNFCKELRRVTTPFSIFFYPHPDIYFQVILEPVFAV